MYRIYDTNSNCNLKCAWRNETDSLRHWPWSGVCVRCVTGTLDFRDRGLQREGWSLGLPQLQGHGCHQDLPTCCVFRTSVSASIKTSWSPRQKLLRLFTTCVATRTRGRQSSWLSWAPSISVSGEQMKVLDVIIWGGAGLNFHINSSKYITKDSEVLIHLICFLFCKYIERTLF